MAIIIRIDTPSCSQENAVLNHVIFIPIQISTKFKSLIVPRFGKYGEWGKLVYITLREPLSGEDACPLPAHSSTLGVGIRAEFSNRES